MRSRSLGVLAPLLLAAVARADGTLERFKLENGLTVLLRPVEGAKEVAVVTFFPVGDYHDPGISGFANLLLHVYVTAAAGETPARHGRALFEGREGRFAAVAGPRHTAISSVVPPERLQAELEDAAARMGALRIEEADLLEERTRVCDALREADVFSLNAACALASERIRPSPHDGRRGGIPEQVVTITLDDLRGRWQRYYKPRNAVLVLAGAVKPGEGRALVTRLFAPLPQGEAAPEPERSPPGRPGTETLRQPWPNAGEKPHVCYAWAAPDPGSDDFAPFLVLVTRMWQAAWDANPVWDVRYTPLRSDTVVLTPPHEQPFAGIDPILDALSAPVPWEPELVGNYLLPLGLETPPDWRLRDPGDLHLAPGEDDLYGLAYCLGVREVLGFDPAKLKERLKALTEADLERARRIFAADRRTCVVLEPEPIPKFK